MSYLLKPHDLELTGVKLGVDGKVDSGYVVNGNWYFIRKDGVEYACYSNDISSARNSWPEREHYISEMKESESYPWSMYD